MPDPQDPADLPVGPVDASGEPDRPDDLPPAPPGLDEPEREAPDPDDLPAGEPEDNPDDLTV
jgi:hypothetical protein